jgi:hypothetical protein
MWKIDMSGRPSSYSGNDTFTYTELRIYEKQKPGDEDYPIKYIDLPFEIKFSGGSATISASGE